MQHFIFNWAKVPSVTEERYIFPADFKGFFFALFCTLLQHQGSTIQIPHTLLECCWLALPNERRFNTLTKCIDAALAQFINTHIFIKKEFIMFPLKMVSIETKIMWHVIFNIVNQHTKFGDIQTEIIEIIVSHDHPLRTLFIAPIMH